MPPQRVAVSLGENPKNSRQIAAASHFHADMLKALDSRPTPVEYAPIKLKRETTATKVKHQQPFSPVFVVNNELLHDSCEIAAFPQRNWHASLFSRLKIPLAVAATVFFVLFFVAYKRDIETAAMGVATEMRAFGLWGVLLCALIVFIMCFPVALGFGFFHWYMGYVYGFPGGLLPSLIGLPAGCICCYLLLSQRRFNEWAMGYVSRHSVLLALSKILHAEPLKLSLLCRASVLPFVSVNVLLSVMRIGLRSFVLSLPMAVMRAAIHIYIGASIRDLSKSSAKGIVQNAVLFGTVLINVTGAYVCFSMLKREMHRLNTNRSLINSTGTF